MSQIWNHVTLSESFAKPEVGMGATVLSYTDRHAYTIVEVSKSGKTIKIQEDTATRKDANGMSESQDYEFSRNPKGAIYSARFGKKGWKLMGMTSKVLVGVRDFYYDYSF